MTDLAHGDPQPHRTHQPEPDNPSVGGSTKPTTFVPGQPDMWAFVLFETLVFTSYLAVYLYNRTQHREAFLHAQAHLNLGIGIANTLVLLLSSWSVARCVQHSRDRAYRAATTDALLTGFFGLVFLGIKIFEWVRLTRSGFGFTNNEFFSYYYFLTAIHALHLIIGFVAVGVIVYQLRSPARRSQKLVETAATYWHTVDFLWVIIFSLLYIVR